MAEREGPRCSNNVPGCGCEIPWPYEKQCHSCRDNWEEGEARFAYCICTVTRTFKMPNGMVATFGEGGQIPELQGEYTEELHRRITERSDENTQWEGFGPLE